MVTTAFRRSAVSLPHTRQGGLQCFPGSKKTQNLNLVSKKAFAVRTEQSAGRHADQSVGAKACAPEERGGGSKTPEGCPTASGS